MFFWVEVPIFFFPKVIFPSCRCRKMSERPSRSSGLPVNYALWYPCSPLGPYSFLGARQPFTLLGSYRFLGARYPCTHLGPYSF